MKPAQSAPVTFPDRPFPKGIWIGAAVVAITFHLAFAAFAITRTYEETEDDDLGAPGIEIAVELASVPSAETNLPPGPESDASAASAPVVAQQAEVKDPDLPKETPVEAVEPDRLVAVDTPKNSTEDERNTKMQVAKPAEESVAQEATAAPTVPNVAESLKSTTRDQGTAASLQRARVTWQKELLAHLDKYKRYPADRSQKDAEILIALTLDRMGQVVAAEIIKGSGDRSFDDAALSMISRASPVPQPPASVADEGLSFSLPVIFRKSDR